MVRVFAAVVVSVCIAAPAYAQSPAAVTKGETQLEGLYVPPAHDLRETHFRAGELPFEMFAGRRVDVMALVKDVVPGDDATAIQEKVNEARQRLYPKDEIILAIGPGGEGSAGKSSIVGVAPVRLVKQIYWWNLVHYYNEYWWARYRSATAIMFTNVLGRYYIYDSVGTRTWGSWVKRKTLVDTTYARTTYGPYSYRGFRGVSKFDPAICDVVLYFFN